MPANIETMMYHDEMPWHGIGTRLADDELDSIDTGIQRSGLGWTVRLEPLYLSDGRAVQRFATVRDSDNSILGNVGPKYRPLQNREAFNFMNPFLQQGVAKLHTAGSIDKGRVVWVLCHVSGSQQEVVKGDRIDQFILLSNSHDGTQAIRVGFTPIRVVCANTLAAAHGAAESKLIRVRHTKSMHDNLAAIQDVMDVARKEFAATLEQYRRLAAVTINQADVRKYVKIVLNIDERLPLDEIPSRTRNVMFAMEQLAECGTGNNLPGVRGTLWSAYNGVTEYLSYGAGSNREKRLDSLWFGSGAERNKKALDAALAMAS